MKDTFADAVYAAVPSPPWPDALYFEGENRTNIYLFPDPTNVCLVKANLP